MSAAFFAVAAGNGIHAAALIMLGASLICGLAWNILAKTGIIQFPSLPYSILLFTAGIGWFFVPGMYLLGLPFLLLAAIEKRAGKPLYIVISGEGIRFESLLKKSYGWADFSNVILKDGLLTLDFKNNRLAQKMIDSETDEAAFNGYCRAHLITATKPAPVP